MSNLERQRRFQASHPGYDRRRVARKRAAVKRGAAQRLAALAAQAAAAEAKPQVLMLPAPVEDPVVVELNALATSHATSPAPEPVPLAQQARPMPLAQQARPLWFIQKDDLSRR